MRFIFSNVSRPKGAASKLQDFMVTIGKKVPLTQCQDSIAIGSGYRNWSELTQCITSDSNHLLDENAGEELAGFRQALQKAAFAKTLQLSDADAKNAVKAVMLTASYKPKNDDEQALLVKEVERLTKNDEPYTIIVDDEQTWESMKPVGKEFGADVSVWVMAWEESERGWGTRPDGYSIHPSESNYHEWLSDYGKKMDEFDKSQGHGSGYVPDEYDRPVGDKPFMITLPFDHPALARMPGRIFLSAPEYSSFMDAVREAKASKSSTTFR